MFEAKNREIHKRMKMIPLLQTAIKDCAKRMDEGLENVERIHYLVKRVEDLGNKNTRCMTFLEACKEVCKELDKKIAEVGVKVFETKSGLTMKLDELD